MGRPQKQVESFTSPAGQLAVGLRAVRRSAGNPPYRVMARESGYAASTLSKAAAGDRLPTWEVCSAFVESCGGDITEWKDRWNQAQERSGLIREIRHDGGPTRGGRHARPVRAPRGTPAPNPRRAADAAGFVGQLRLLKSWADLTLTQVVANSVPEPEPTKAPGARRTSLGSAFLPTLSKSTVSDALRGDKLPRLKFVEHFVRACGGIEADVQAWTNAWKAIRIRELMASGGEPGKLLQQVANVVALSPASTPPTEPVQTFNERTAPGLEATIASAGLRNEELSWLVDKLEQLTSQVQQYTKYPQDEYQITQIDGVPAALDISTHPRLELERNTAHLSAGSWDEVARLNGSDA